MHWKYLMFFLIFLNLILCREEKKELQQISLKESTIDRTSTIHLATLDWQPYIVQDLNNYGYVYQLVKEIFEDKGYKVQIRFYPWSRTMQKSLLGEVDGYFPEYFNEELKKDFYFSNPFPGGPVGFYGRKDIKYQFKTQHNMKDFRALISYQIGIVRGYTNTKYFDEANYLTKQETV